MDSLSRFIRFGRTYEAHLCIDLDEFHVVKRVDVADGIANTSTNYLASSITAFMDMVAVLEKCWRRMLTAPLDDRTRLLQESIQYIVRIDRTAMEGENSWWQMALDDY